ncbi:hypothetical protein ACIHCM_00070 [Streptomyces sp. NPDC052023]|uniref:hypothetical protein n=1 Tax=Streptomyces sp. NPDC052023 TaxID=3365681 RepID=UPI0037CD759E
MCPARAGPAVRWLSVDVRRSGHPFALHEALARATGTRSGMIGVSAPCDSLNDIPHHYQEAQRALEPCCSASPCGTSPCRPR